MHPPGIQLAAFLPNHAMSLKIQEWNSWKFEYQTEFGKCYWVLMLLVLNGGIRKITIFLSCYFLIKSFVLKSTSEYSVCICKVERYCS